MPVDPAPFPEAVAEAMRADLPAVAERAVEEIIVGVPSYADAFLGPMGRKISTAVEMALRGFLQVAVDGGGVDAGTPGGPVVEAAYALGRGEARSGRSMDALLAAYRVGARVSWRDMSATAVRAGLDPMSLARFAELVFAYIDRLSAASVAGHADELASSSRERQRLRERLARGLLTGSPHAELAEMAQRAEWTPPRTLTAVLLPEGRVRGALVSLDPRTLVATEDLPGTDAPRELSVLLVPDAEGAARGALLRGLAGRRAVVGPARPWWGVQASYGRALRALRLDVVAEDDGPLDTDARLAELVLRADEEALADLRARALAPLATVGETAREKLTETLRSWLLHHGRRDQVAAALFVHPQTVRYRMTQLRELYGPVLEDPQTVLELTIALGVAPPSTDPG
ncbi:PucR family transcriptional regulator [Blastococcus sp. MG754426]|uniref:PucR family transcriptional regulator n=1 Tax=unclassified Blastococcus TaxID=2619396 RepID=UPI001EEFAC24|nr:MULTISPECIES: PucR family transcriptional regulator [unclassified Blastococcus]MCF6507870.1 PucR family transcriptional regulator [Blastococcus sp. MG754426]MCF6512410.1 PucR family transcriptional regulator [Blastococcus sp. MG754427]MCF6735224.1 PucR family transcriptional regulator [Blastococcus sp. KM273129]